MGFIIILVGAFFFWIGFKFFKNADINSKANPQYSSDVYKMTSGLLIFTSIIMIGCGAFIISLDSKMPSTSVNSSSHKCAICGKSGARQITNQAGDDNYYCTEHYADAWQYYYGN